MDAIINLMPSSIFKQLGLGKVKPTRVKLKLVDRLYIFSRGEIENELVKVKNIILPTDFVVLDMEEDKEAPIIMDKTFSCYCLHYN